MLTLENWPALLEAGTEIHPQSWTFFVSYVLLASFPVINILIAIIINSVEEVHELEQDLQTGGGVEPAAKRLSRPSKGGRMRG